MRTLRERIACALAAQDKHIAAARTLELLGYTYHGGELWKPPLGQPAVRTINPPSALHDPIVGRYRDSRDDAS